MTLKHFPGSAVLVLIRFTVVAIVIWQSYSDVIAGQPPLLVKPLSLEECLKMASKNSITIQAEKNNFLAAKLNSKNVEMERLPDLMVGVSYRYEENNEDHQAGELFPYISLSQVVFNDEKSYTAKLDAVNKLVHAEEQLEGSQNKLYADVITKYFALLSTQNQLELEKQSFEQSQTDYTNAQIRSRDGLISKINLMKTESMFELAKVELDISQNQMEQAEFELSTLINIESKTIIRASDTYSPVLYNIPFNAYRQYAEKHNPVLNLNRRLLKELPKFRNQIKRTSWPTVSLSAYFGKGATQWDDENRYGLSINVSKPLYDFGKTKRRQQMLALELDSLEKTIIGTEQQFFSNLQLLHNKFTVAGTVIQKSQYRKELTGRLTRATEKSYEMGIISQEQLLKNRRIKKEREQDYMNVVNRYLAAEMLLKLNCGISEIQLLSQQGSDWLQATNSIPETKNNANNSNTSQ